jgi:hypothetical protein
LGKIPLALNLWDDKTPEAIVNKLGRFSDKVELRLGMFTYAQIYVELNLEEDLLDAIEFQIDNWTHVQPLMNYEKLPCQLMVVVSSHFNKKFSNKMTHIQENANEFLKVSKRLKRRRMQRSNIVLSNNDANVGMSQNKLKS